MEDTIFSLARTNPNNRAMIVPQEDGGVDDDHYFGSIGDATQKHIGALSSGNRQIWEDLYCSKNGKIFRFETTPVWNDPDPFSMSGEDLEEYFEKLKKTMKGDMSDEDLAPLREAVEQEQERRAKSEDMFDMAEQIPYHLLQEYPGMEKHAEIPAAPIDRMCYMGDCNQLFYDEFPEDHPDAKLINDCLGMLNKKSEKLDKGYGDWMKRWVLGHPFREESKANLLWLIDCLVEGKEDPEDLTRQVLAGIENVWRKDYLKISEEKSRGDAILQLLKTNQKRWSLEAKQGRTVYGQIKRFGQMLFQEYKGAMKQHHWNLYRRIKEEHIPRVMLRGIDVNRCKMVKLTYLFETKARDVWLARPFESMEAIKDAGYLTRSIFVDDDESEALLAKMEQAADKGPEAFNEIRKELIESQRNKMYGNINWTPVWAYYHLLKTEFQTKE